MAYLQKRGPNHWLMRVYAGSHDGTQHIRSRAFHGSERAAKKALAAFQVEVDEGKHAKGTFGELAEQWYEFEGPNLAVTTAQKYRQQLDRRILPAFGALPLNRLTVGRLEGFYQAMQAEGLKGTTIDRHHATIRAVLNFGIRRDVLTSNVAIRTKRPKVERFQPTVVSVELCIHLLDVASRSRERWRTDGWFGSAAWVAVASGMRRGELCGLRWSRVDLDAGLIRVDTAIAVVDQKLIVKDPKSHQHRDIEIDAMTVNVLRAQRVRQAAAYPKLVADPYVWSYAPQGRGGVPPSPDWLTQRWRRLCEHEGVTGIRLHDMRHFMATALLSAGEPLAVVSKRLGHAQQSTTSDIYSHVLPGADSAAARTMGALMGGKK